MKTLSKSILIKAFVVFVFTCQFICFAQTKQEFLRAKVPPRHDFTKIPKDAKYKANHLIVRFAPDSRGHERSVAEHENILNALGGGTLKKRLSRKKGLFLVELPKNLPIETALKRYNARGDIYYAEPDYLCKATSTPLDPLFSQQWALHNIGQEGGTFDADIDALEAWTNRTNAENIIVAVTDEGVDYTHPDLAANMWKNEAELNGLPDVDDDGNGYTDDIYGYNFYLGEPDPTDGGGHGTKCAGIIGAVGNNNLGITGICWHVKIMALGWLGEGNETSSAILSIEYAVMMGAKVINASWETENSIALQETIEDAGQANVLFVTSAGNDGVNTDPNGVPHYPSCYPCDNIISVMATDHDDVPSVWPRDDGTSSTSYGQSSVDIAAPGTHVLTCCDYHQYELFDGTSAAAPHVAGACALIWSMNPQQSYTQVKNRILNAADPLPSLTGKCVTGGRLNLFNAMPLGLILTDDVESGQCRGIDQPIVFTMNWRNPTGQTLSNASIIYHVPVEVDYRVENDPYYDEENRIYTMPLGASVDPNSSGTKQITVYLNNKSEPGLKFASIAEFNVNGNTIAYDYRETPVCCWDTTEPDVIFVDKKAEGNNNGTDWGNAYSDLQNALYRAKNSSCQYSFKIYVAQETYSPGNKEYNTFKLPDYVEMYGGFPNGGCSFKKRNPKLYETVLTGQIDGTHRNKTVVAMGEHTSLDGFTVSGASIEGYGIYGSGFDFTIESCRIINNETYGIYAIDGDITVKRSEFTNNVQYAIRVDGEGSTLTIENCRIHKHPQFAIYCLNSTPVIRNSIIAESDLSKEPITGIRAGIRIVNPAKRPLLYNNTIAHNKKLAISYVKNNNDPNNPIWPDVQNCILWLNNSGHEQYAGFEKQHFKYSCIYDPNDPQGTKLTKDSNYNFSTDPNFVYRVDPNNMPDPNNMHLNFLSSPCKDSGSPDPALYIRQFDMDQRPRGEDGLADIGAFEVACSDIQHQNDITHDGSVDVEDFVKFAEAWLIEEPNLIFNSSCDLNHDRVIDSDDLMLFCENEPQSWLWKACWKTSYDCPDSVNVLDYNQDGVINLLELSVFSAVWQQNRPETVSNFWEFSNIDNTAESEDIVDLADLTKFVDEYLWIACWRTDLEIPGGSQPHEPGVTEDPNEPTSEPDPNEPPVEPSNLEIALQLHDSICFFEDLWQTDPNIQQEIDPNDWQSFMDAMYLELDDTLQLLTPEELSWYEMFATECGSQQQISMPESEEQMFETFESTSIEQQIFELQDSITFLEQLWQQDVEIQQNIGAEEWQAFMDSVYQSLEELQMQTVQ